MTVLATGVSSCRDPLCSSLVPPSKVLSSQAALLTSWESIIRHLELPQIRILNFQGAAELLGLCHLNPACVGCEHKCLFRHRPHSCSSHSGVSNLSKNDPSQPISYLLRGHHSLHSHWEKSQPLEELGNSRKRKKMNVSYNRFYW